MCNKDSLFLWSFLREIQIDPDHFAQSVQILKGLTVTLTAQSTVNVSMFLFSKYCTHFLSCGSKSEPLWWFRDRRDHHEPTPGGSLSLCANTMFDH